MEPLRDPAHDEGEAMVDNVDSARANEYELLAILLSRSPDQGLLERLALLRGDASPLGAAHTELGHAAARANAEDIRQEYFDLFGGVGRSQLLPHASYYLTGSPYGRPLAQLRETLRSLGIEKVDRDAEPEDHVAILCEIMAGLAGGHVRAHAGTDRAIFEEYLAPWIGRFFSELECAKSAKFYAYVGRIGRTFIEIETAGFAFSP